MWLINGPKSCTHLTCFAETGLVNLIGPFGKVRNFIMYNVWELCRPKKLSEYLFRVLKNSIWVWEKVGKMFNLVIYQVLEPWNYYCWL